MHNLDDLTQHYSQVSAFLDRYASNATPLSDLVQQTYVNAYRSIRNRGPPYSPRSWLITIAKRVAFHAYHHPKPERLDEQPDSDQLLHDRANPLELAIQEEERQILHQGLQELPGIYRSSLEGFYFRGSTCRELAATYGVSEDVIKVRLYRGRLQLKQLLEEQGVRA